MERSWRETAKIRGEIGGYQFLRLFIRASFRSFRRSLIPPELGGAIIWPVVSAGCDERSIQTAHRFIPGAPINVCVC